MKVFDCRAEKPSEGKKGASIIGRFQSMRHQVTPYDLFVQSLNNVLDNHFAALREPLLPGAPAPLPLVLVGPTGLWVVLISPLKGLFRAGGEAWEKLDPKTGKYKPDKANPMAEAIEKSQQLSGHLREAQIEAPPVEPVVYFSDPGAHVESVHPAARIVLTDGMQRFVTSVLTSRLALDGDAIQAILDDLVRANEQAEAPGEIRDAYSLQEAPAPKPPSGPSRLEEISHEPGIIRWLSKYLPLSRRQWIWIGILLVINFFVLILLVIVVSISS
jgi:hypothetical protein